MYNTIKSKENEFRVIIVGIKNAQIIYLGKGGFNKVENENAEHVKILPNFSIVQSTEGYYDITLGSGKQFHTVEGGFFIAPSDVQQTIVHHVNKQSGKMSARWLFVDVKVDSAYKVESLYQFPVVINDERKDELNRLFNSILSTDDVWENFSDVYKLMGILVKMAVPANKTSNRAVEKAVSYIAENFSQQITVKRLSEVSNMSESNFYAVFKKYMGTSPVAYINKLRLSVAAEKLAASTDSISEIRYSVGIGDPLYFNKLFKRTYAMSPREYRKVMSDSKQS